MSLKKLTQSIKSIYIHYPFCKKKCLYCDFAVHAVGKSNDNFNMLSSYSSQYIETLSNEMNTTFRLFDEKALGHTLKSIYFGGGTPSLMHPDELEIIIQNICQYFAIDSNTEITIECDPNTFTINKLEQFISKGKMNHP